MRCVGDDHCAVGEFDLVAGPAPHYFGGGHHPRRPPVGAEQLITDRDITHRRPAGRRGQRRVQCERLPHSRPGRHDDHLPGMQAVGHLVELGETGRHAARDTAVGGDGVDLVHGRLQQILERNEILRRPALGHLVDLGLCAVDHLGHVGALGARVAVLDDPGAGLHEAPQQRLLGHDGRVVARVGRGRHRRDQGVQIRCPADPAEQVPAVQFRGDRHRVGRFAPPVEVQDRVVHVLMGGAVKVAGSQPFEHIGDGVLAQQHAAQHRLLRRHVLRWLPPKVLARRRGIHARRQVIDDRHGFPPPLIHASEHTFDSRYRA